jgi:hypothetical protein
MVTPRAGGTDRSTGRKTPVPGRDSPLRRCLSRCLAIDGPGRRAPAALGNRTDKEEHMSDHARALADRFEQVNAALITTLAGCDDAAWRATCPDTGWSIAVQADHIAAAEGFVTEYVGRLARGEQVEPVPIAAINRENDRRAAQAAGIDREGAITQLRQQGGAAVQLIGNLTDEQLGRTGQIVAEVPARSVAEWVEYLSIGEIERHGGCIRQAFGG